MNVVEIHRELDAARQRGPLKDILIEPCPKLLMELRAVVRRIDAEPADVVAIASHDVAMAVAVIKVANSPLYARARNVATVAEAVALLGMAHTVSILTGFLMRRSFSTKSALVAHFWQSSTRRATAMGYIARQLFGIDPELAHTCGLFAHIALPVLLGGLKGYEATLQEAMGDGTQGFTAIENAAHHTDHAVVGAIVAKTWLLPEEIALAVRLHHDFTVLADTSVPELVRKLVAMLLIAEYMVNCFEGGPVLVEWLQHGGACLDLLDVETHETASWLDALHAEFAYADAR